MNYRNHSHMELLSVLTNEPEPNRFIEASKEFIQRYSSDKVYSQNQLDEAVIEAYSDGSGEGYQEARDNCRNEMAECIQSALTDDNKNSIEDDLRSMLLEGLLADAKVIG